jgi:molybdenum cofactor biosynthesis enzyme MoaA
MKIRTFSILAGSLACNARCPFCIAGMTPRNGVGIKEPEVNWRRFETACRLAREAGCLTAMITGKGEPTLFPAQITRFLEALAPHKFPLIEIQTNGSVIADGKHIDDDLLKKWRELGLITVAVSVVHHDAEKNRKIFFPRRKSYFDLPALIKKLHDFDFSVRLTTIAANGLIDSPDEVKGMIEFARANSVEQLTITPVTKPDKSEGKEVFDWVSVNGLTDEQFTAIKEYMNGAGTVLNNLPHGARVFDFAGQNACLNNCITVDPNSKEMRSIIFFPDGHVRYAWQYSGAILF